MNLCEASGGESSGLASLASPQLCWEGSRDHDHRNGGHGAAAIDRGEAASAMLWNRLQRAPVRDEGDRRVGCNSGHASQEDFELELNAEVWQPGTVLFHIMDRIIPMHTEKKR